MKVSGFFHYVISAPNAHERRETVLANFKAHGLEPQFFEAVMGNKLPSEKLKNMKVDTGFMSLGEVGCILSHLGIYKKLLKSHEPYVFIFEDESYLTDLFFEDLPEIQSFMESHTDPVVLILYKTVAHTHPVIYKSGRPFILRTLGGTASHGYVINRKAAENMLRVQSPPRMEIDAWAQYYKLNLLNIYCTENRLVHLDEKTAQESIIDKIAPRIEKDRAYVKKNKAATHERIL